MSDTPNVIVGENLRDFLALGSRFGYFALEGLVHEPDETIAALRRRKYDEEWTAREIGMLKLIERTFSPQTVDRPAEAARGARAPLLREAKASTTHLKRVAPAHSGSRVLAYWPRDRYLELAPKYWRATRGALEPMNLLARCLRSRCRHPLVEAHELGRRRPHSRCRAGEDGDQYPSTVDEA
jgi:hypothetical protein